jgi:hypothetical protein
MAAFRPQDASLTHLGPDLRWQLRCSAGFTQGSRWQAICGGQLWG